MVSNSKKPFPGSHGARTAREVAYAFDPSREIEGEAPKGVDSDDFRVDPSNPETGSRADRLREAVRRGGGNKSVSAKSGVPISTLGVYLTGGEWKVTPTVAIAQACGVSVEWLITGRDPERLSPPPPPSTALLLTDASGKLDDARSRKYAIIPMYDVKASAGDGSFVEDEGVSGYVALEHDFVSQVLRRRRKDLVTISATGDSMEPTVHDGDLLFVDTSVKNIENSRIYVLNSDGVLLVKRLSVRLDGSIDVRSDNPKYEPEMLKPSERNVLRIIGQVIYQAGPPRS